MQFRAVIRFLSRSRLVRGIHVGTSGLRIEAPEHVLVDVRLAFDKLDPSAGFRVAAIEEPQVAVAGDIDQSLEGAPVALEVNQDGRRHFVPVPGVIRVVLEVPLDRASGNIQSDGGGNIEIVAGAPIAHPRATVANSPIREIGGGIVVAGHPHRATAGLPLVTAFGPRFAAGLSRRRYGVSPPLLLPAIRIISSHEAADAELTARCAHHHLAAGDQRSERDVIRSLAVRYVRGPDFPARSRVQCNQDGFTRCEVNFVAVERNAAAGIVPDNSPRRVRPFISPEQVAGADIERDHLVVWRRHEEDAIVDQWRRFVNFRFASGENPDRAQAFDIVRCYLVERAIAPAIVCPTDREPIPVFGTKEALCGYRLVMDERGGLWLGLPKGDSRCRYKRARCSARKSGMKHGRALPKVQDLN